ncbi:efflux transporter outer membrane subunit [Pseudaminobacter sp. NGMCC 1.201702]|uniref:efflux transporter outer membrane subunit n=1 Tax=Pseudaminobacter sp. NGMCC 1.201702 TaxID=3391825 RepID=UPI0039EF13E9
MRTINYAVPFALLFLAGCVTGPDHEAPQTALPGKFGEGSTASNGDVALAAWWNAFGDARLDRYVASGLEQNLTVQQAIERINQAQADVIIAGAGSLPSLIASASNTTRQQKGSLFNADQPVQNDSSGGLRVSWLIDLFGQYRRAKESASASLDAAYASVDIQRLAFISQVISAYIDLRYYQERIEIARQNLKSRRATLALTKQQLAAGATSRLDVTQAEGLIQVTLAEIPELETNFRRAAHRIATLLGLPASSLVRELQEGARQPVARAIARSGIPADLLRNRPDIRAAERLLAASVAKIGVAESQLYPSVQLSGSISPSYIYLNSGPNGSLNVWSFGPTLVLPILDGGRLRANVANANSAAREQYLEWKEAVLVAVEEVENALAAMNRSKQTEATLRKSVEAYKDALSIATTNYRNGVSTLLEVLDAQRSVADAQANLARAVQQTALSYVSLNVAVGGEYANK